MKNRLNYIDATKGVAILCITFLHIEQGVIPIWLNTWISLFMTSAFFITSGWISGISNKSVTAKELFIKRIKQLGVPYLWFSLLIILFDALWVTLGLMGKDILLRDMYKTITLRGIGTLWFLPALLIGEYIFALIRNCKNRWIWGVITMIATLSITYFYNTRWMAVRNISETYKMIDAPIRTIINSLHAWPIIAIGYILGRIWGKRVLEESKIKLLIISATLFAISIILITKPPFNIYYINGLLSNTLPAIAFLCLFAIFQSNIIERFFTYWGMNSLILMCTHYSITMEILLAFDRHMLHNSTFEGARTIIYFVICILMTYPLVYIFNGKLRFMIGKK